MRVVVVGAILAGLLLSACDTESCYLSPTTVILRRLSVDGGTLPELGLAADAFGRTCGCCGGRAPARIVFYAWDLNGDGAIDQSGADLSQVDLPVPAMPITVSVTVSDTDGNTATDSIVIKGP